MNTMKLTDKPTMRISDTIPTKFEIAETKAQNLFKAINDLRRPSQRSFDKELEGGELNKLNDTCFATLVRNKVFEVTTLLIIVLNALFIGYDTDYSARWGKPDNLYQSGTWGFPVMENTFAIYFTFEVGVRFFAFRRWADLLDAWWIFDTILVAIMVTETYILAFVYSGKGMKQLSVLRLLRLLRITRMGKLMRYFPDLQVILRGMLAAVRSVGCTAILLVLMLYVFSIIFTSVFHQGYYADDQLDDICGDGSDESPQACAYIIFGSLGKSMRHLFIMGTILDDITKCMNTIRGTSEWLSMLLVFIAFVIISSFTMLNMLIGILCEVVQATSEGERLKSTANRIREAIRSVFAKMDVDHNGKVSRDEFLEMRNDEEVNDALKDLNVRPKHFKMYADLMFQTPIGDELEEVSMNLESIADMLLHLRPGSKVNALDFATFSRSIAVNHYHIKQSIDRLEEFAAASENTSADSSPLRENRHVWQNGPEFSIGTRIPRLARTATLKDLENVSELDIISELQARYGTSIDRSQSSERRQGLDPPQALHQDHSIDRLQASEQSCGRDQPQDVERGHSRDRTQPAEQIIARSCEDVRNLENLVEAFQMICDPQLDINEEEWSSETYTC